MISRFFLGALLLSMTGLALAQDVKIKKYVLPNGMKVILHEDHSLPVATVNIWYYVGSKDEPEHRSGFAHLFEHLMFMGTDRVPTGQYDKIMEGGGGSNNASTAEDRTNYFDSGPANLLPTLLWLEADRLEDLGRTMTQKKLDLQRDVVKNERRQNTENTPYGKAYETINGLMYPSTHPYHTSVIGSMEDLDNASVKDVQAFFGTYYVPNNASLVVAGDFRAAEIEPLIAQLFGSLPRRNDVPRKATPAIVPQGIRRMTLVDQVQASKTIMVWHSPAAYRDGDAEMNLAASILSGGLSSRLYQRLVVKDKLATDVNANQGDQLLGSLFTIDATLAPGASQDALEHDIDDEVERFAKTGPTTEELKRQSATLEFQTLSSLQSIDSKADKLNEFEYYLGEPNSFKRVLDMFRAATPSSVKQVVARTLDLRNRLILRVVSESAKQDSNPRNTRPAVGGVAPFDPQSPTETTLSNGIKVFFWHRPELPLMSVGAFFRGGADLDDANKAGSASMAADMLTEGGAGSRDAQSYSKALDLLGAQVSVSAGHQNSTARLSVIAGNFDKALDLLSDALMRPKFDPKEWARVQRVTATGLEQANDDPSTVASKVSAREFFGADHPYGRPVSGTPATIRSLTTDDLRKDYARVFQPSNMALFVAGSLDEGQTKMALEKVFGKWKGVAAASPVPTYPKPSNDRLRVVVVDKPGAVQTVVRFVFPSTDASDPNRLKLSALSLILGGSFTSRLNSNLREDKGYTYGAGSQFVLEPHIGYLVASADVRADVTGASIKEFLKEFAKIRTRDVTDAEASKADSSLRTDIIQSLTGLEGVVSRAMSLYARDLPFTSIRSDLASIAEIRATDINALANESIPLEKALLVLVGDKSQILGQLEGLGLPAPVEVKP
ncbi:MAG: pitrilysin family protein [Fimbriimonas sp.]|nr:pitrilysin family protein [Fimbriimonas sp.]